MRHDSRETNGERRGEIVYIAKDTVALVHAWLERVRIASGRQFGSVEKGGRMSEQLDPSLVPGVFKAMAHRADLPE